MTAPDSSKSPAGWARQFEMGQVQASDYRLQRFYAGGVVQPETPIVNVPMLAMDFETTGMRAEVDEIVSIGVVGFTLSRIMCREAGHWVINPGEQLDASSVIIHGITHAEVEHAPPLESILEQLLAAMTGRIVVVHYRHMERDFLNQALKDRLGEGIQFPVIDTMELEKRILLNKQSRWQRWNDHALASLRLGDCRERYNLPHYQPHHALTDALATAELLQAQIAWHFADNTPIDALWC